MFTAELEGGGDLRHPLWLIGSINYQVWMLTTEALCDVTVPAHWLMSRKYLRKLLWPYSLPFDRSKVRTQQRGRMV